MKCPNCGAEMALDPNSGKLVCDYCDTTIDPEAASTSAAKPTAQAQEIEADGDYYQATVYMCQNCGAELMVTDDTAVTFCSYCGAQAVIRGRMESMKKPDFVIPFSRSRQECEEAYRHVLKKSAFAPDDMTQDTTIEKFRGIYMPYWVYDMEADSSIRTVGQRTHRRGDYLIHRHYRLDTSGHASYKGISFDASSSFSDNLSRCIAPYDLKDSREFDPVYLSGFYTDRADVDADVYRSDASGLATAHVAQSLMRDHTYGAYGVSGGDLQRNVGMHVTGEKMGLFPVWFLGCRSKDGQRISYAVVNGQTGKVAADLPMDFRKYLLGSLALAVPLFLLLNLFLTLTPTGALIASVVLAVISLFITNGQLNEIYTRENQLDDKGIRFAESMAGRPAKEELPVQNSSDILRSIGFGNWWKFIFFGGALIFTNMGDTLLNTMPPVVFLGTVGILGAIALLSFFSGKAGKPVKKGTGATARMPFGEKQPHLLLQEIAVLLALLVLVLNPAGDIWFYGAAALSMVCICISFRDLVQGHNQLTTRKLPQMAARGGDEHEM